MNCSEFGAEWNRRLDAARAGLVPLFADDPEGAAHAASCDACRAATNRYSVLLQAIGALPAPPAHDPVLTARILATLAEQEDPRTIAARPHAGWRRPALRYAAAAALALICFGGLMAVRDRLAGRRPAELATTTPSPISAETIRPTPAARPLNEALSEAASATLSLARESSAPAARIGRDMIGSAAEAVGPVLASADETDSVPRPPLLDRLGGGVPSAAGPWSTPARNAFGFLVPRLPGGGAASPSADPQPL
jgi:hypothetical protein